MQQFSIVVFFYVTCILSSYGQDSASLRTELSTAQVIVNNALEFIVQNFRADRYSNSISSFSLYDSRMNPVESILYGFISSNPRCDPDREYSPSSDRMQPCLVNSFASQYAVQVKFRSFFISGNPLSSRLANKYLLFLAYNIDGLPILKPVDGQFSGINGNIAYFLCYNPVVVKSFSETDITVDGVNNGIRVGGNVTSPKAILSLSTPDSRYGGVASCLTTESNA